MPYATFIHSVCMHHSFLCLVFYVVVFFLWTFRKKKRRFLQNFWLLSYFFLGSSKKTCVTEHKREKAQIRKFSGQKNQQKTKIFILHFSPFLFTVVGNTIILLYVAVFLDTNIQNIYLQKNPKISFALQSHVTLQKKERIQWRTWQASRQRRKNCAHSVFAFTFIVCFPVFFLGKQKMNTCYVSLVNRCWFF